MVAASTVVSRKLLDSNIIMKHHVDLSAETGDPVPQFLIDRLDPFRTAFTARTWSLVLILVMGAVLSPGKRTVSSCLRITGYAGCATFSSFHQVLNRARWWPKDLAKRLLHLLVAGLSGNGPIIIGLDDTIERRWGKRISARGIYRDPVRSSRGHFVKTSGLRWLGFMLLTPVPWMPGIKALPFLTLLAPSERYAKKQGLQHKKLTDWARQGMLQIIRWLPDRLIIFVGDSSFGTHELANCISP
ncbi:transposase [Nitratireductor sp. XY-223]|uniref:transposase n=1 Tax=Nitratireductor sp. XY-223 TaxID=2561926 RepID=UPI001FEE3262|nr:transposase [Nitratireductor sp. XY-223]